MKQSFIIIAVICVILCTFFALVKSGASERTAQKTKTELCCKKVCGGDNQKQKKAEVQDSYMLMNGILGYQ